MDKLTFHVNGQFVSKDEAKISVSDLGFCRGYSAFEFLRTYNGKPFKPDEHLLRLQNSCDKMFLQMPPTSLITQTILKLLEKNQLPEAVVKIYVTGGESDDGFTPKDNPSLIIMVSPLKKIPDEFYEDGVKVITVNMSRQLPQIKSTNYISAIMAKKLAKEKGAIEAIYKNDKEELLEATQCNFFGFKGDTLVTAKEGVLLGITRSVVLELAAKEFTIDLRPIKYSELKTLDEAFISSTSKEIVPVVQVDDILIGNNKVGKRTKRLMDLFKEYTRQ